MAKSTPSTGTSSAPQTAQEPSGAPGNAVAVPAQGGALAMPSELLAELGQAAKDIAAQERPPVGRISLRAGIMKYQDQALANNELNCVVLTHVYENAFYADRFNADKIVPPACFALALSDDDMRPHERVPTPVNATCTGCKYNEWSSDPNGGRGKACKQRRRLVLLPASALNSPEEVNRAELALLSLPVMSVKRWASYVNQLAAASKLPPFAVITTIKPVPDPKSQFVVTFTPQQPITDPGVVLALMARRNEANNVGLTPYDMEAETEEPPAGATKF